MLGVRNLCRRLGWSRGGLGCDLLLSRLLRRIGPVPTSRGFLRTGCSLHWCRRRSGWALVRDLGDFVLVPVLVGSPLGALSDGSLAADIERARTYAADGLHALERFATCRSSPRVERLCAHRQGRSKKQLE